MRVGGEIMKRHNALKVVLCTLAVFLLLTWILPTAYFQTSYVTQGRIQMGLFDIVNYPMTALQYFGYVPVYVLIVGGFYGVLNCISAYRILLDKLANKFKSHSMIAISIIMILFAVITSICGLNYGLLLFFPFVISLVFLMGYDKIVAIFTTVGSVCVGLMGTTLAYNNTGVLASVLSLDVYDGIVTKIIILVLGLILLIFNTMMYIKKMPKKSSDNELLNYVPEQVKAKDSKNVKVWPLVLVLDVLLLIMILAFISWSGVFKLDIFDTATSAVTGFKIGGFTLFGKLLGTVNSFGNWSLTELNLCILMATILLALIYKIKFNDLLQKFIKGGKEALQPAVILLLIYTGLVIVTYHPFQLVIYKSIIELTKGFNAFTASLVAMLASIFNADPMYTFNSAVPYLVSIVKDKNVYTIIWVIFQSIYGFVMLLAPTSVVLMATLAYLNVSFKEWFKNIWKLALEILVILLILFTILVLI